MPRANRHYIPGQVWHITHRCHKKEFLLKFSKDRRRWHHWAFEARKRFGLRVLNFVVTSNHAHILVLDSGPDVIANSMQLIAGRTGQEYNERKGRKGAFWEDRYHATAVEKDEHLIRCLVYIDLNMVRAGAVSHPSEWEMSGFRELHGAPERYRLVDRSALQQICGIWDWEKFQEEHRMWVESALVQGFQREGCWTESIAVGSAGFIEATKASLGARGRGRRIQSSEGRAVLREGGSPYGGVFASEKGPLSPENAFYWDLNLDISDG